MDGENEKGKREGGKGRTGDKLMRICACEQVSAEKEEGGGRRKSQRKSMREQESVNSFTF